MANTIYEGVGSNIGAFGGLYNGQTFGTPNPTNFDTINSNNLQPQSQIPYQTPNYGNPYPVSTIPTTDPYALSPEQRNASNLNIQRQGLFNNLLGESQYRTDRENFYGVSELEKTQRDLETRLNSLKNEALAIPLQLQQDATGRGITKGGLAPIETGALRTNAIQALSTSSLLEASRGNLTTAMTLADRAVSQRFDPIREQIKVATANLDSILQSPEYTNAEKRQAQAQKDIQSAKDQEIKKQEENSKIAQVMAGTAVANNPGDQGALIAAQQLQTLDPASPNYLRDAFALVGKYQSDPNATQKAIDAHLAAQQSLVNNSVDNEYKRAQIKKINSEVASSGVQLNGKILNPQYAGVLGTILGSGKFTKDQKANIVNSINNGEDPFTVIKNRAKDIMGQTEATTITKYEVARDTLAKIGRQLAHFYAGGGKTNIFTGNFEKVANKLGAVNDENLVNLATQIQGNLQIYRNAISGTAYSAQEGKDIASIFPGINKTETLNKAILNARSTLFDSVIDASYSTALGPAYDKLKLAESSTTGGSATKIITYKGKRYSVDAQGNFDENKPLP